MAASDDWDANLWSRSVKRVVFVLLAVLLIMIYIYEDQMGRFYNCVRNQQTVCIIEDPQEQ